MPNEPTRRASSSPATGATAAFIVGQKQFAGSNEFTLHPIADPTIAQTSFTALHIAPTAVLRLRYTDGRGIDPTSADVNNIVDASPGTNPRLVVRSVTS